MNFDSLSNKPNVDNTRATSDVNQEGQQLRIELMEPTMVFNYDSESWTEHTISPEENGRPDLVSYKYFGTVRYADAILKANGINNPFIFKEGTLLLIPSVDSIKNSTVRPEKNYRITEQDQTGRELNNRVSQNQDIRPNQLRRGQSPFRRTNDNRVILGGGF